MQLDLVSVALLVLGIAVPLILPSGPVVGWVLCLLAVIILIYGHRGWLRTRSVSAYTLCLTLLCLGIAAAMVASIFHLRPSSLGQPADAGKPGRNPSARDETYIGAFLNEVAPAAVRILHTEDSGAMECTGHFTEFFKKNTTGWTAATQAVPEGSERRGIRIRYNPQDPVGQVTHVLWEMEWLRLLVQRCPRLACATGSTTDPTLKAGTVEIHLGACPALPKEPPAGEKTPRQRVCRVCAPWAQQAIA